MKTPITQMLVCAFVLCALIASGGCSKKEAEGEAASPPPAPAVEESRADHGTDDAGPASMPEKAMNNVENMNNMENMSNMENAMEDSASAMEDESGQADTAVDESVEAAKDAFIISKQAEDDPETEED